jgi:hypothetical protein
MPSARRSPGQGEIPSEKMYMCLENDKGASFHLIGASHQVRLCSPEVVALALAYG